jgi:hypothetical protein
MKCSHHFPKSFAIGDTVHFQESIQPFTFLGYTGKVTYCYGLHQQSRSETGRGPRDKEVDRGVRPRFGSGGAGLQLIGCALYYVLPRYLEVKTRGES